ncbi:hypothetical protein LIER_08949 [Lithospermum erythrorhizon]|uniref:MULE transposase domain-containing protein n=1 Tax=Lithospermum erythrorhizon TaxID=34254 RepID=A0AAV3PGS2_LITER
MHPYEQECEDDDDVDEDDDDVEGPIMLNKYRHLQTPALIPNMIFANSEVFRLLIREYALVTRRDVKLPINEKKRVQAVCRVNGCPFKVYCSKNGSEQNMSIKSISGSHICGSVIKNKQISVKWLAHKYVNQGSFKGQILAAVLLDANNGIYPLTWAVLEVENTESWTWFVKLLREYLGKDVAVEEWIIMTDQQKGLENAITFELPFAEHHFCVKHLHVNFSKIFYGKKYKDMMWETARASNAPFFEAMLNKIKKVSVEAYEALDIIDRKKWTKSTFRPGSNCDELVNNLAEAFNKLVAVVGYSVCARCVLYMAQNKDSRLFVNDAFKKTTQIKIYNHLLEPIRGPMFWPNLSHLPIVLLPIIRVLLGRPEKCRTVDANEKREKELDMEMVHLEMEGRTRRNEGGRGKGLGHQCLNWFKQILKEMVQAPTTQTQPSSTSRKSKKSKY